MNHSFIALLCLLIFISTTNGFGCADISGVPLNITHCELKIGVDDGSCCTCATFFQPGICTGEGCVEKNCTDSPTLQPSQAPSRSPSRFPTSDPTELEALNCTQCPFNITLVSIGNISISPCPVEEDCNCEDGLVSFTSTYLGDEPAESITFYYSNNILACPVAENVTNGAEIVCSIGVSGETRFGIQTRFVIEYVNGENCIGTFDTSCTTSIFGEYGDGCSDLVVSSWTDISGGICAGNVSLTRPPTSAPVYGASSDNKNSQSTKKRWRYKDGSDDSSNSRRRRRRDLGSGSASWDGDVITDSWYTNKKCVPNCYQWGLQRNLQCGCYESCSGGSLNTSCYEGNEFGYCEAGICCCGGDCITTQISDSVSSDGSGDGYYSYSEWFADRCGLSQSSTQDLYYSVSDSSQNSDSGASSGRRRRRFLGASFGSMRRLRSADSSSYGDRYNTWTQNDAYNDFLIETCVTYEISGSIPDCIEDIEIFLPICSNNLTDFNVTNLNASDISGIITSATFDDGSNVLSAVGVNFEGELGIMLELIDYNVSSFEVCLGNVSVSAQNVDSLDVATIDISAGVAIMNSTLGEQRCAIDGLPCFNFFFDADCPPTTTDDGVFRSCECTEGMVEINLLYAGTEDIAVTFYRRYKESSGTVRGDVYASFGVSPGGEISVSSSSGGKDSFARKTGVVIEDSSGEVVCVGYIQRCAISTVGQQIAGCSDVDLVVESWASGDGALCDSLATTLDGSSYAENALISNKQSISGAFNVFQGLDPYIKYSLTGILVTFAILMFIACYICVARNNDDEKKENVDNVKEMHDVALQKGTQRANEKYGVEDNNNERFDDEYYDEDGDKEEDGNEIVVEMQTYKNTNNNAD